ncbi:E3 ubiquitin-protein ligase UPL5-like [Lolium rigidum]|uniref:E3 ubiquitin-protein ligase UPL5-like n=1 Tax=Lolium rigidum TaxID=89674 RepID=UPI001F5CF259|nr:E3 ubiquitin-protein ligase UPL5-like [Lolium rigidum]
MTPISSATVPLEPGYLPDWSNTIRLFVQNMDSRTIVIMARPYDTLGELLGRFAGVGHRSNLHAVFDGRQLPPKAPIGELRLPPDAMLHLTPYPEAWSLASQIAAAATAQRLVSAETAEFFRNFFGNDRQRMPRLVRYLGIPHGAPQDVVVAEASRMLVSRDTVLLVRKFLDNASTVHQRQAPHHAEMMGEYLDVLLQSGVIGLLVRLYLSNSGKYHNRGKSAILSFLIPDGRLPLHLEVWSAPVFLQLCRLIASGSTHGKNDPIYRDCRGKLANLFSLHGWLTLPEPELPREWLIEQLIPLAQETADEFILYMGQGTWVPPVFEFRVFFSVLCRKVRVPCAADSSPDGRAGAHQQDAAVDRIWVVLDALDSWSETHGQFAAAMRDTLMAHAAYFNALVLGTSAGRSRQDDMARIVSKHRDILGVEARRHFSMAMLPELDADLSPLDMERPLEMLIYRSQLLFESLLYISTATRDELHAGLDVEFVNEEAIGDGVAREWVTLVCRALFDPQQGLFSPCPHNRRRFFLNPALAHKIQVGVLFDRTLFSRLSGRPITLEDIADADPSMYASCRKILEMDPDLIDSNALGLTFAREVGAFGSREVIELLPGGRDVPVDSKNRSQYIDLLIQDLFANSTKDQLNHFAEGFRFMLVRPELQRAFFQSLDLEDLDQMLGGRMSTIDVQEWKENTTYRGYSEQDDQINWFWKAVASMTAEEQRRLLFFWTSVEYLPFDGFGGSELSMHISKASSKTPDHLPSSRTCMYRLNLPCYTSFDMTLSRLRMVAQDHVSNSFGEI